METDPTESPTYLPATLPATSPGWVVYYQRAKETRRLGKGQHANIQRDAKRRRRRANLTVLASTVLLVAVIAACVALLDFEHAPAGPTSRPTRAPTSSRALGARAASLSADPRRG